MSKVTIAGNASGTGVFTITSPNSNTDRTLTLPDSAGTLLNENSSLPAANLTGTIAAARMPAGSVLQVVRNTQPSNVTSTTSTIVSVLSANITPSSVNSKVLVMGMSYGAVRRNTDPMYFYIALRRGSTAIGSITSAGLGYSGFETVNATKWVSWQDCIIDEPASTSSLTYNISFGHTDQQYGGYSPDKVVVANSVLLLMEIAA